MLEVGQKVRVKSSLQAGRNYGGVAFVPEMAEYRGRTFTISLAKDMDTFKYYRLEDISSWSFSEEMLTTIESEADTMALKVGDTVKILKTTEADRSLGINVGGCYLVSDVDRDGDIFIKAPKRDRRCMTSEQYIKVTSKTEFTFSEVIKMLTDKEVEEGQEFINEGYSFFVKELHLYTTGSSLVLRMKYRDAECPKLTADMIHKPWTLVVPEPEPEIEMTVAEIQEKLGHKVKIVDK